MMSLRARQTLQVDPRSVVAAVLRDFRPFLLLGCVAAALAAAPATAGQSLRLPAPKPEAAPPPDSGAPIAERVSALEGVLAQSGLDVDALIARLGGDQLSRGLGGPLVLSLGTDLPEASAGASLESLQRVEKLLAMVPLAAPMATYQLTSGFGHRRDPFTGKGAVHTGLDFGGPRNAPVLATAPGRVAEAKRAGAYGIMVEIDHGMGIRTRYAHLRMAAVRVGQKVAVRKKIGIMGSTGRSTGAHLHYEIRVDGQPLDPAKFLAAGGQLRQLVGG
jgi:murein DD-endopeptidase MepM/ murein hydrolase activator NlpD